MNVKLQSNSVCLRSSLLFSCKKEIIKRFLFRSHNIVIILSLISFCYFTTYFISSFISFFYYFYYFSFVYCHRFRPRSLHITISFLLATFVSFAVIPIFRPFLSLPLLIASVRSPPFSFVMLFPFFKVPWLLSSSI